MENRRWPDGISLFINATPADGAAHFEVWHNGGPGGFMFACDSEDAAITVIAAVEELLERRAKEPTP